MRNREKDKVRIILIRHGMTAGNYKKKYIGRTDEELMNTDCLDRNYPDCSSVVTSPLLRCVQTAKYIYPSKPVLICTALRECDFGDFENKSYEELKGNPDYERWLLSGGELTFPGGESSTDFKKRCINGFFESVGKTKKDTAFVIHGGSIMAIMERLFGGDFYDYQVKNGEGYIFDFYLHKSKAANAVKIEEYRK